MVWWILRELLPRVICPVTFLRKYVAEIALNRVLDQGHSNSRKMDDGNIQASETNSPTSTLNLGASAFAHIFRLENTAFQGHTTNLAERVNQLLRRKTIPFCKKLAFQNWRSGPAQDPWDPSPCMDLPTHATLTSDLDTMMRMRVESRVPSPFIDLCSRSAKYSGRLMTLCAADIQNKTMQGLDLPQNSSPSKLFGNSTW